MSKKIRISLIVIAAIVFFTSYQLQSNDKKLNDEIAYHNAIFQSIAFRSNSFENGGIMPLEYTAKGANISPAFSWDTIPEGTKSFAIIATDYDAPAPYFRLFNAVHWVLYNIPLKVNSLDKGISDKLLKDMKISTGKNYAGNHAYTGPRPPLGIHSYYFRIYALDFNDLLLKNDTKDELLHAIKGHILGYGEYVGKCGS